MTKQAAQSTVSFTINVGLTDASFVEKTLRHMLRSLRYPFAERLVALDTNRPTGDYAQREQGNLAQMHTILEQLLHEGLLNRVDEIPWDEENLLRIIHKYFGCDQISANYIRDYKGAPIYQYLYALDQCTGDYVLHADSDILFHSHVGQSWIDEGVQWMQMKHKVVITTLGHPPRAGNLLEYLIGRPLGPSPTTRWHESQGVSTRYFLWDRQRIEQHVLPFLQKEAGESLEKTLTHTLQCKGYRRCSLNGWESWAIHPMPHNENFIRYLDDLIWAVENNIYPFRRKGRYPWNLYTYDRPLRVWLQKIHRAQGK